MFCNLRPDISTKSTTCNAGLRQKGVDGLMNIKINFIVSKRNIGS